VALLVLSRVILMFGAGTGLAFSSLGSDGEKRGLRADFPGFPSLYAIMVRA
jgi:hypothetical protein